MTRAPDLSQLALYCAALVACQSRDAPRGDVTAPPAGDATALRDLAAAVDSGADAGLDAPAEPGPCYPNDFTLRCWEAGWVECDATTKTERRLACEPGLRCREPVTHPFCVHPDARPCDEAPSARCQGDVAFNCPAGYPWESHVDCAAIGRRCAIAADGPYAQCVQPGATPCPFQARCEPAGCVDGKLQDCCYGFLESRPCPDPGTRCVPSTRPEADTSFRICLPADYEACNPQTFTARCEAGQALTCFNYLRRETCRAPNDMCRVSGDQAICTFANAEACEPGSRGLGCTIAPLAEKFCHETGLEQWAACPSRCECMGYWCTEYGPGGELVECAF